MLVAALFGAALAASPAAAANSVYTGCHIMVVGTLTNRVHILCDQPYPGTGIQYFAVAASQRDHANQFVAIALAAQVTGATAYVYFDEADTSGSSIGCQATDCRLAKTLEIHGVGPLASAAHTLPAIAPVTLPEPERNAADLAAGLGVATLVARRRRAA
jgi:hypothetical protein